MRSRFVRAKRVHVNRRRARTRLLSRGSQGISMDDPTRGGGPAEIAGFVAPIARAVSRPQPHASLRGRTCARACTSCGGTGRASTRRAVLRAGFAALAGAFVAGNADRADSAEPGAEEDVAPLTKDEGNQKRQKATKQKLSNKLADDAPRCKNCLGNGKVPCDLCSGTGFWRALARNDVNQKYQGVVCPECEGVGTLTCPVCLGTGEGNIRGLLRRRRVEPGLGRILQTNEFDE
jgi:hypothetical protein